MMDISTMSAWKTSFSFACLFNRVVCATRCSRISPLWVSCFYFYTINIMLSMLKLNLLVLFMLSTQSLVFCKLNYQILDFLNLTHLFIFPRLTHTCFNKCVEKRYSFYTHAYKYILFVLCIYVYAFYILVDELRRAWCSTQWFCHTLVLMFIY